MLRISSLNLDFRNADTVVFPLLVTYSKGISWALFHSYGMIIPVISVVFNQALVGMGFVINDFFWIFPFAFIGFLCIVMIYALVRQISGKIAAFCGSRDSLTPRAYPLISLFLWL